MKTARNLLVLAMLCCGASACEEPRLYQPESNPGSEVPPQGIALAPIDGLTSSWHVLIPPAKQRHTDDGQDGTRYEVKGRLESITPQIPVPLGVDLVLSCSREADETVRWSGATETNRLPGASIAHCVTAEPGPMPVAIVTERSGIPVLYSCVFNVMDVTADEVRVIGVTQQSTGTEVDDSASNLETMAMYFGETRASVRLLGERHYRTGVNATVRLNADVEPAEFASLMEWQIGNDKMTLGSGWIHEFTAPGTYVVAVGPPGRQVTSRFDVFSVEIHGPEGWPESFQEVVPMTFHATTNPEGCEEDVCWLSSTRNGRAWPVVGTGPEFTVTFQDTRDAVGAFWLGVKANEAVLGMDGGQSCSVDDTNGESFAVDQGGVVTGVSAQGLCIRTPLGPGEITFMGCTPAQLADFRVLPEVGAVLVVPVNGVKYDTDGFWWAPRGIKNSWFKIPDHCSGTLTCNAGGWTFNGCCNVCASVFFGGVGWVAGGAKTADPFNPC